MERVGSVWSKEQECRGIRAQGQMSRICPSRSAPCPFLVLSCSLEVSWVDCVTDSTLFFLLGLAHEEL